MSVIIPTRDRADLLRQCIDGLLKKTDYQPVEIIIVDNDSVERRTGAYFAKLRRDPRIRILPFAGAFNYSAMNNAAAAQAKRRNPAAPQQRHRGDPSGLAR